MTNERLTDATEWYVAQCHDGYYAIHDVYGIHEYLHDRCGPFPTIDAAQVWIDTGESQEPA